MATPTSVHLVKDTVTGSANAALISIFNTMLDEAKGEDKSRLVDQFGHYVNALMILTDIALREAKLFNSSEQVLNVFDYGTGGAWVSVVLPHIPEHILLAALTDAKIDEATAEFFNSRIIEGIPSWPLFLHHITTRRPCSLDICAAIITEFALHLPDMASMPKVMQ